MGGEMVDGRRAKSLSLESGLGVGLFGGTGIPEVMIESFKIYEVCFGKRVMWVLGEVTEDGGRR